MEEAIEDAAHVLKSIRGRLEGGKEEEVVEEVGSKLGI